MVGLKRLQFFCVR